MPGKLDKLNSQLEEMQKIENQLRLLILTSSQTVNSISPIVELVTPLISNLGEIKDMVADELIKDLPDDKKMLSAVKEAIEYHRVWIQQTETALDNIESAVEILEQPVRGKYMLTINKPSIEINDLPQKPGLSDAFYKGLERQQYLA